MTRRYSKTGWRIPHLIKKVEKTTLLTLTSHRIKNVKSRVAYNLFIIVLSCDIDL